MVVYAAGSVLLVQQIKPIYDKVLLEQVNVARVGVLILVAYLFKGLGAYASSVLMADVGQRVVMDIRNQLFRHLLDQSAAFFARRSSGQLLSRITNDVGQVQQVVSETAA